MQRFTKSNWVVFIGYTKYVALLTYLEIRNQDTAESQTETHVTPCRLWAEIEAHKWRVLALLVDHILSDF